MASSLYTGYCPHQVTVDRGVMKGLTWYYGHSPTVILGASIQPMDTTLNSANTTYFGLGARRLRERDATNKYAASQEESHGPEAV